MPYTLYEICFITTLSKKAIFNKVKKLRGKPTKILESKFKKLKTIKIRAKQKKGVAKNQHKNPKHLYF